MKPLQTFEKDSDEQKDYGIDWAKRLTGDEVIVASVWEISPADGTLGVATAPTFSDTQTTIWINAGRAGRTYKLINRVTTDAVPPRILERALELTINNN